MAVCLIFPFLFLQNQMLDYSKRSRSGKFRLVTKFKKEKNNKNKETHSSMALPGTNSARSLCLFVTSVCSHHYLFPVSLLSCSFPSSVSCASAFSWRSSLSFSRGKVAYCSFPSHCPPVPCKYSWAETGGTLWKILPTSRHFRGCLVKWIWGFWHFRYLNDCGAQVRVTPVFSLLILCDMVNDVFLIDSPSGFNQVSCIIGWGSASPQVHPDL